MSGAEHGAHDDFDEWSTRYHEYYPANARLDQEFRTSRLLVLASRSWTNRIDRMLRLETGQSRARWQVLFTIGFAEQPATMTEICHRARVQWPTMMRVVQDMERDGLIEREDCPVDRRSKLLRLTAAGEAVIARIQPTLDRERAALLAHLSDEELRTCETMLRRIFEAAIQPRGLPGRNAAAS
jgi:MarR family transcriptional regulator for hemolysin